MEGLVTDLAGETFGKSELATDMRCLVHWFSAGRTQVERQQDQCPEQWSGSIHDGEPRLN